jgi:hypothetical protein
MDKAFYGIMAMIGFFVFNIILMNIFGGVFRDLIYTGVVTLCGVIVICTCIIVEKLNKIIQQPNEQSDKNNLK